VLLTTSAQRRVGIPDRKYIWMTDSVNCVITQSLKMNSISWWTVHSIQTSGLNWYKMQNVIKI
jgi:hypothetical protein